MAAGYIQCDNEVHGLEVRIRGLEDPSRRAYQTAYEAHTAFTASKWAGGWKLQGSELIAEALKLAGSDHRDGIMQPPLPDETADLIAPVLEKMHSEKGKVKKGEAFRLGAPLVKEIFEYGYRNDGVGEKS